MKAVARERSEPVKLTASGCEIRTIGERDLPAVAQAEAEAFADWRHANRGEHAILPRRTLAELRYAVSFEPDGNFVAESPDGSFAGFVLSRTWGEVGWFGTLAVPTRLQGRGIGKALVSSATDYLRGRSAIVGLETMPESGSNIGLYASMGFEASHPAVIMELPLISEAERLKGLRPDEIVSWGAVGPLARKRLLGEMRAIGEAIVPGLDYTPEVRAIEKHGLGRTLLALSGSGAVEGLAILRTAPFREMDTSGKGYLHILAVRPGADAEDVMRTLLRQVWTTATMLGLSRVVTGLSTRYAEAVDMLMRNGFSVVRALIRMVDRHSRREILERSPAVNLSRWAG